MEIGSEFETDESLIGGSKNNIVFLDDKNIFMFSGRTCIDYILKDIKISYKDVKKAYLPRYCCQSMIHPFVDNDIECKFYSLNDDLTKAELDNVDDCQIILIMGNYFGFNHNLYDYKQLKKIQSKGKIVIEDCTHSLFSEQRYENSDYRFASIRKWLPVVSGAICMKKDNFLYHPNLGKPDKRMLKLKQEAMCEKKSYINNETLCKESYLKKFEYFNEYLVSNYKLYGIDDYSKEIIKTFDFDALKKQRIKNAKFLIDAINNIDSTLLVYKQLQKDDCPLFVPIKTKHRDKLKKALIHERIYCPSHWPKPSIKENHNLYDTELSLVCDQRYDIEDMNRIIECISKCNNFIEDK